MKHEILIDTLQEIDAAAERFLGEVSGHDVIAFYAPMGAGKTTFTSAICRCLGVGDAVCSPTFTIINEYESREGDKVYHFDFYRIDKMGEALDLGLDDYFYSGSLCLIEWPEKIEALLPEDCLAVSISVDDNGCRHITWED